MNDFVELRQVIASIIRRWWLLVLMTGLAAAAGYTVSQRQTPVYTATTTIMVGQFIQVTELDKADILANETLIETYADMARRQPVLQAVIDDLNLTPLSWKALKKRVKVQPVAGTQLFQIKVEANSPEVARIIADEVARQLILLSPTTAEDPEKTENQEFARQRLKNLRTKIEAGQEQLVSLEAAMDTSLSVQQIKDLQEQINTLENLISGWGNSYSQLLLFLERNDKFNSLTIIEPAQATPRPVRPEVELTTIVAGVVGFLLALGLIFMLEFLDDTFKSTQELTKTLGVPTLGVISRIKGKKGQNKLLVYQDSFAPAAEAYRMIRSNLQFITDDQPVKSLVMVSPNLGEGKSFTVANLGVIMAQADLKTIIVDADLRQPTQHHLFQVSAQPGLAELLREPTLEVSKHLRKTRLENLQILTSGAGSLKSTELLGSQRMQQLLDSLTELADVVIIDSPPALALADAAILSNKADGVVLIIEAGRTRRDETLHVIASLQQAKANLLGVVLNRATQKQAPVYYKADKITFPDYSPHLRPKHLWQWLPFFK
jgi:succinoglycan biosynthesis transport protein ExoP